MLYALCTKPKDCAPCSMLYALTIALLIQKICTFHFQKLILLQIPAIKNIAGLLITIVKQIFRRKSLIVTLLLLLAGFGAKAQNVAIKTNLISDAVTSPNLGFEFRMAPKWTFDISGQVNAWNIHNRRWRHWMAQPEVRVWYCEAFQGSFWGLHAIGGQFNIGNIPHAFDFLGQHFSQLKDHRYQGWGVGGGISYGYDWILAKHWNLEFEIGVGYIYCNYDKYPCTECGTKEYSGHHNYFGPTKLALAIEYLF